MTRFLSTVIVLSAITGTALLHVSAAEAESEDREFTITNAYDAFGRDQKGLTHDFGFSSLVRYRGKAILFDAGTDADIFRRNLDDLGIDPGEIDIAIASHGHHDHIGGFDYLLSVNPEVKIYLPKDFFSFGAPLDLPLLGPEPDAGRDLPKDQCYFDCESDVARLRSSGRFWKANVKYVTEPTEILPGVTLVPTTSELMGTFVRYPPFEKDPKLIGMPELSVSFATERGDVLIAGCSHSTIEAIILEAKRVLKKPIYMVAGGFHLIPYDRSYLIALADRMQTAHGIRAVAPAHCTGHLAFAVLREQFGDQFKFFGLGSTVHIKNDAD